MVHPILVKCTVHPALHRVTTDRSECEARPEIMWAAVGIGWEGRDVEGARVRGVYPCSIWEAGNNGRGGWENIGGRHVGS